MLLVRLLDLKFLSELTAESWELQIRRTRSTGAIYDCLFAGTEAPKCALIPPAGDAPGTK
jgi:hypothetical protein